MSETQHQAERKRKASLICLAVTHGNQPRRRGLERSAEDGSPPTCLVSTHHSADLERKTRATKYSILPFRHKACACAVSQAKGQSSSPTPPRIFPAPASDETVAPFASLHLCSGLPQAASAAQLVSPPSPCYPRRLCCRRPFTVAIK